MTGVYFSSPGSQVQAEAVVGWPVLLSYALYKPWVDRYVHAFGSILVDSGAYSAMNSGTKLDASEYAGWAVRWKGHADAIAGLDDIEGNWKKSLANYAAMPAGIGFPTIHDTDPPGLLDELVPIARERGGWIGIGLKPPRTGKAEFVQSVLDRVPDDLHVHGWALRAYAGMRRFDSFDSTNWFQDGFDYRTKMPWLTYGECLEIVVKRYIREGRMISGKVPEDKVFGKRPSDANDQQTFDVLLRPQAA